MCGENAAECFVEKAVEVISGQLHNSSANCHAGNVLPKIMSTGLSKNSIEYRTTRAIFAFTKKRSAVENEKIMLIRNGYRRGKSDMNQLLKGKALVPALRSVQRFKPKAVDYFLSFILSSENVSYTSWGTTRLQLNGEEHVFPAVTRKKTKSVMYKNYCSNRQIPSAHQLKKSSFFG